MTEEQIEKLADALITVLERRYKRRFVFNFGLGVLRLIWNGLILAAIVIAVWGYIKGRDFF